MKQRYDSYKPSGIDWIGDIPSHWKLPRVKQFVKINNGSDPKTEGDIPVYGSGSCSFKTCGEFKLGPTVLLGRKGATLHIPHWIEGKYWNVDTAFDTNIIGDLNLRLFFYFSMLFNYEKYKSETTLPSMTQTDYGNMYIPLPSLAEQEAIAAWLDEKCGEIDAAIAKVDREIELIDELKQSEISRVVTRGLNPDAPLRPSGIDWIGDIPKHWIICKVKHLVKFNSGDTITSEQFIDNAEFPVYGANGYRG
ncbi:MAG: restriction endonuclease subunit S, partial [Porphyromonadaceae bacterium]|nr:restriction endonuclease subunit S [Porphyromonadaceae bacterium]